VITSRWDLAGVEVAYRMFERWRQENFFKYLREEFLLDALADYQVEPDDPTRTVPNPEGRRPAVRGFKIAHGQTGKQLLAARERLTELLTRRRGLPQRVEAGDRSDDEGRTLLHELFHAAADIEVTGTELLVTICPLRS